MKKNNATGNKLTEKVPIKHFFINHENNLYSIVSLRLLLYGRNELHPKRQSYDQQA